MMEQWFAFERIQCKTHTITDIQPMFSNLQVVEVRTACQDRECFHGVDNIDVDKKLYNGHRTDGPASYGLGLQITQPGMLNSPPIHSWRTHVEVDM